MTLRAEPSLGCRLLMWWSQEADRMRQGRRKYLNQMCWASNQNTSKLGWTFSNCKLVHSLNRSASKSPPWVCPVSDMVECGNAGDGVALFKNCIRYCVGNYAIPFTTFIFNFVHPSNLVTNEPNRQVNNWAHLPKDEAWQTVCDQIPRGSAHTLTELCRPRTRMEDLEVCLKGGKMKIRLFNIPLARFHS